MPEYKKFEEKAWMDFGKSLLEEKGSEKTKTFLWICKSKKNDFLDYMDEHLLSRENSTTGKDHMLFEHRFTEREFLHPPRDTQQIIWNTFREVPDEILYSGGFWGCVILKMIEGGYIKQEYLAAKLNGVTETGNYAIDEALKSSDETMIDKCARRILRSMCNPAPRGKRILFNDCHLSKVYWRWHWSHKMSEFIDLELEQILEILDENYYATFSEKMHTGKSYISYRNVLGGLLLFLDQAKTKKITNTKLGNIIDKLSYLSAWKAIEEQRPNLNQQEIKEISVNL